jgi:SAM-dependent methyltransferase
MHHREIIKVVLKSYKNPVYLELGLFNGDTWNEVSFLASKATGVDIVIQPNISKASKEHKLFAGTTDKFFATLKDFTADVIFIDADHNYKSVKKDFENALRILKEGGCILLHDTDPSIAEQEAQNRCGDSYRIVDDIEKNSQINIVTIPHGTDGISIVKRVGETRTQIRKRGNK